MLKFPLHLWVTLSNWVARSAAVAIQLVTIPMLTRALGQEQFSAYAVTVSLLGWFILLDLGMGYALQNFISEARVQGKNVGGYITVVFLVSTVILCVGSILIVLFSPFLARFLFANMPFISSLTGSALIAVAGLLFLCNAIGTIGVRVLYALGQGIYANLITLGINVLSLGILWLVVMHVDREHLLFASVLAYAVPLGLIGLVVTIALFIHYGVWHKPSILEAARQLFPRARGFWLFALLGAAVLNVDYLVMSQTLSPEDIAKYNILSRIFGVMLSFYWGLLTATWPVWAEFIAGNEWFKVNHKLRIYISFALFVVFMFTVAIGFIVPYLLSFFLPDKETTVTLVTILLFGLYLSLRVWTDTYAVALQAVSDTGILLRWVLVQAVVSISAQWLLSQILGLNGILFGLILSFSTTVVWVLPMRLSTHVKTAVVS